MKLTQAHLLAATAAVATVGLGLVTWGLTRSTDTVEETDSLEDAMNDLKDKAKEASDSVK